MNKFYINGNILQNINRDLSVIEAYAMFYDSTRPKI